MLVRNLAFQIVLLFSLVLQTSALTAKERSVPAESYAERLSSKNPRAITHRIVKHPDTGLSALLGLSTYVQLSTIMGEPTVFCPAVWWLDEIYDASGGVASVHKRRISSIPEITISELDLYKAKLIIELKSGHLLRCDAGVMSTAFSEQPSFTVPASPSWSKLLFYDESRPDYVGAEEAKRIWRDLRLRQQASRYAISHIRIAEDSAINLWPLARFREQEAMAAYGDKVTELENQNAAPSAIEAVRKKVSEHSSRFRQAFNSGMTFSSRYSRRSRMDLDDCMKQALQSMSSIEDAGAVGVRMRDCSEPQPSGSEISIKVQNANARPVGRLTLDRDRDQVVRALSHGALVQRYNELIWIAANGRETNLDLTLPPRYRMSSGQVLELEQGSFIVFNGKDRLHRFDRNGTERQQWKLLQTGSFIVASDRRYGFLDILPGPGGQAFVAFLSGKRRDGPVDFNIVQLREQRLHNVHSENRSKDQSALELDTDLYGPNHSCWASVQITYERAGQQAILQQCIRADGSSVAWNDDLSQQLASAPRISNALPAWIKQENYSGHNQIFFASTSKDHGTVFVRRGVLGQQANLSLSAREKVLAVDSEGACFSSGRRLSAQSLSFYCLD